MNHIGSILATKLRINNTYKGEISNSVALRPPVADEYHDYQFTDTSNSFSVDIEQSNKIPKSYALLESLGE